MAQTQFTGFVVNSRKLFTILWQGALSWPKLNTYTDTTKPPCSYLHWHLQRYEYIHKGEMVWGDEPQTVTRQHHNLVADANYKQILRERPKTRHCNQEQTRNKLRVHWYIHFHWKEHFSESNWKTLKIQRPWNQSWKNLGDKSYNNSGSDRGHGTNQERVGKICTTDCG